MSATFISYSRHGKRYYEIAYSDNDGGLLTQRRVRRPCEKSIPIEPIEALHGLNWLRAKYAPEVVPEAFY